MGAAVEPAALAACIRDTLEMFLADHPGMEEADLSVSDTSPDWNGHPTIRLEVIGHAFELRLVAPEQS